MVFGHQIRFILEGLQRVLKVKKHNISYACLPSYCAVSIKTTVNLTLYSLFKTLYLYIYCRFFCNKSILLVIHFLKNSELRQKFHYRKNVLLFNTSFLRALYMSGNTSSMWDMYLCAKEIVPMSILPNNDL